MENLHIKSTKIALDPINSQIRSKGRNFILSGVKTDLTKPPVFIKNMYKHYTYYSFKYLDNNEFFGLYFDPKDNFVHKLNHTEILEILRI